MRLGLRWGRLGGALALAGMTLASADTREGAEPPLDPPAPRAVRMALEDSADALARAGRQPELLELESILLALGHPRDELERAARRWERGRDPRSAGSRSADGRALAELAGELREQAGQLARGLSERAGDQRERLARLVGAIDDQNAEAAAALGHVRHGGRWCAPARARTDAGAARVRELTARARTLEPEIELVPSELPAIAHLDPGGGSLARGAGVAVHGTLQPERLRRVLSMALRGAALSNALLGGSLEVPPSAGGASFLLVESHGRYRAAVDEARATGGLDEQAHALQRQIVQSSFRDRRGWRTCDVAPDADLAALLLWDLIGGWLGPDAQPCLTAGHLNWICGELYGTPMPATLWRDAPASASRGDDDGPEWRAARRGTAAARLWSLAQLQRGRRTPLERCLKPELGAVDGPLLVRATLTAAYLQELGTLAEVVDATRRRADRRVAFEQALGCELPVFDQRWERWLVGAEPGIVQRLDAEAAARRPGPEGGERAFVQALVRLRARVLEPARAAVELDPELSAGALDHARYLALNPDLRETWEDLHLQRADRPGYGEAGARAGMASMVHLAERADPAAALDDWMATCLHRLPLLEPGLFGLGLGLEGGVLVADVTTLVEPPELERWVPWPPPGAEQVPLRFVPEIPSPVRGLDQVGLGYPITLQVRTPSLRNAVEVELSLHLGAPDGPAVEVHRVEHDPARSTLLPPGSWCLIPAQPLEPRTRYAVRVTTRELPAELGGWTFTTAGAR